MDDAVSGEDEELADAIEDDVEEGEEEEAQLLMFSFGVFFWGGILDVVVFMAMMVDWPFWILCN